MCNPHHQHRKVVALLSISDEVPHGVSHVRNDLFGGVFLIQTRKGFHYPFLAEQLASASGGFRKAVGIEEQHCTGGQPSFLQREFPVLDDSDGVSLRR